MRYKLTVAIILGAAQLCGAQNALRDFESFRDSLFSGYHRYRQEARQAGQLSCAHGYSYDRPYK